MSPEELDEARAEEAYRQWREEGCQGDDTLDVAARAARLARENWTPPEPVDPDVLAFREWVKSYQCPSILESDPEEIAFLAGARMAAERERERARPLVEYIEADERRLDGVAHRQARDSLAKYRGEAR